jgi:hypothetical protein
MTPEQRFEVDGLLDKVVKAKKDGKRCEVRCNQKVLALNSFSQSMAQVYLSKHLETVGFVGERRPLKGCWLTPHSRYGSSCRGALPRRVEFEDGHVEEWEGYGAMDKSNKSVSLMFVAARARGVELGLEIVLRLTCNNSFCFNPDHVRSA